MKAIVYKKYGPPANLSEIEIAKPVPTAGEVLIKIHASTVTPVDIAFRAGTPFFARLYTGLLRPKNPVLGTELAGVVEAVGSQVSQFEVGDAVFAAPASGFGAHAEYICLPAAGAVIAKPANLTLEQAATICNGALTALPFLRDTAQLTAGQRLLVIGASGSIGTAAVQLGKHIGAHVTGVCSTSNLKLVASLGADRVIDYTQQDFTKSGALYNVIFDTVGKCRFPRAKASLSRNGIHLSADISLAALWHVVRTAKFSRKKARVAATGLRPATEQRKDMDFIRQLIEAGTLSQVVDRVYPMEQIANAHRYVAKGHKVGNVVVAMPHENAA
jgi:NADPH:quinone reductase-like Zn-dependent oxidoreductase